MLTSPDISLSPPDVACSPSNANSHPQSFPPVARPFSSTLSEPGPMKTDHLPVATSSSPPDRGSVAMFQQGSPNDLHDSPVQSNAPFDHEVARQIWNRLAEKLDSSDRKRYFSPVAPEVRERSKKVQNLLLQIGIHGNPGKNTKEKGREKEQLGQRPCTMRGRQDDSKNVGATSIDLVYTLYKHTNCNRNETSRPNLVSEPTIDEYIEAVETACNTDIFVSLCLLFDTEVNPCFEMIAVPHFEHHVAKEKAFSPLVLDILLFAHGRAFGFSDAMEQAKREEPLLRLADVVKTIRALLGLPPYEIERYKYLNKSIQYTRSYFLC